MTEKKMFKGMEELNALRGKVEPKEMEIVLDNLRLQNDFLDIVERKIVEDKLEEAKKKLSVGEKPIISINPLLIHVPEWQRDLTIRNANKIGLEYNPYKWELPKLMCFNGKLYVVDGHHRTIGAIKAGLLSVQYEVLIGITEAEAQNMSN